MGEKVLAKIKRIKTWQALLIIVLFGFLVYGWSLGNQFQSDDYAQIVNSPLVHSLKNVHSFFKGGTFYDGDPTKLAGPYYRPLMTSTYSVIYSLFGANPFYYHLIQLILCMASSCFLYLFFRLTFKPLLSLLLALIFLAHPIDSQVVYAIPSMHDALFFFFGIGGLCILAKYRSIRSLLLAALLLLCSVLSKETGLLFIVLAITYIAVWDRKRLKQISLAVLSIGLIYFLLRSGASGLNNHIATVPIDNQSLIVRLITLPSIFEFYFAKFMFPWKLTSGYYWVHKSIDIPHFVLPLLFDLFVGALGVMLLRRLKMHASKPVYFTGLYFSFWVVLSLGMVSQILPFDMTACETWFYIAMPGLLGLVGLGMTQISGKTAQKIIYLACVIVCLLLGVRTAIRGPQWKDQVTMAYSDISSSKEDYVAYSIVAQHLLEKGDINGGLQYAKTSVTIYPSFQNLNTLGLAYSQAGQYADAKNAYLKSISIFDDDAARKNLGLLCLWYGDSQYSLNYLANSIQKYPTDGDLKVYYGLLEYRQGNVELAKQILDQAATYTSNADYFLGLIDQSKPVELPSRPPL